MLRFREFRHQLYEAEGAPEPAPAPTPAPAPPPGVNKEQAINQMRQQISDAVDKWVNELKQSLVSVSMVTAPRGLWDRFKNSLSNLWYGRHNQENPYFWQNKLGDDLGRPVESVQYKLGLNEYKVLREICEELEDQLNEEGAEPYGAKNLRIMQLINQSAARLKQALNQIITNVELPSAEHPPEAGPRPEPRPEPGPEAPSPAGGGGGGGDDGGKDGGGEGADTGPKFVIPNELITSAKPVSDAIKNAADLKAAEAIITVWLNGTERNKWDDFGGGKIARNRMWPNIPWILRLNDPRTTFIEKYQPSRFTDLKNKKRIELDVTKIKTQEDFDKRLLAAKSKPESEKRPDVPSLPGPSNGDDSGVPSLPGPSKEAGSGESKRPDVPSLPGPSTEAGSGGESGGDEPSINTEMTDDQKEQLQNLANDLLDSDLSEEQMELLKIAKRPKNTDKYYNDLFKILKTIKGKDYKDLNITEFLKALHDFT